ncbi:MAG: hypothetical protein WDN26_04980 [Chitinophagaceae bacterium]
MDKQVRPLPIFTCIAWMVIALQGLMSCRDNQPSKEKTGLRKDSAYYQQKLPVKVLKQKLTDSLYRFSEISELVLKGSDDKYVLLIKELNGIKTGIIAINDSVMYLFQKTNKAWQQTDSIPFNTDVFNYTETELNGDHNYDFIVYGFPNMHGQCEPYVFIADSSGALHYRDDIHQYNIEFDSERGLVKSYYIGGAFTIVDKEYYRWENDSLILVRGVEFVPPTGAEKPVTIFYTLKNGKRYDYKKVLDPKVLIYDTALWKFR